MGEDDHQVDEPHAAQHGQDPVEHVHHGPVLRAESSVNSPSSSLPATL